MRHNSTTPAGCAHALPGSAPWHISGGGLMDDSPEQRAARGFETAYGRKPRWIASAPGRVNLIGEFTDFNGGYVLPMAIEQRTALAVAPKRSKRIELHSELATEVVTIELAKPLAAGARGSWGNYPTGIVAGFQELGLVIPGFDGYLASSLPPGAGLSSSAALSAATALALEALSGARLDPELKARLCQAAEHRFAGVPCGIMDPYISILGQAGHVLLLDCETEKAEWIRFDDTAVTVLIVNTNVKHELAAGAYAERRAHCDAAVRALGVPNLRRATFAALREVATLLDDMSVRCARHVIGENERTLAAARCIRDEDFGELGRLMYASHDSLRDDYRVSCPELDAVVDTARGIGTDGGVWGCRMTGGGFGGCAVAVVRSDAVQGISEQLQTAHRQRFTVPLTIFGSRPSAGAGIKEVRS